MTGMSPRLLSILSNIQQGCASDAARQPRACALFHARGSAGVDSDSGGGRDHGIDLASTNSWRICHWHCVSWRWRELRFGLVSFAFQDAKAAGESQYKFLSEIPIGGEGGWDILTVDSPAHRLYLSHATKVVVVDLAKNAVVGEITDTPGVHGFVVAPELQRGFSTNGKEAKASVVDLKTLKTISKVDTGEGPDALVYERVAARFTFSITKEIPRR